MTKRTIESVEHLNIVEVSKDDIIKRYEISAETGYIIVYNGERNEEAALMIFPAKFGLENILAQISVEPADNK